MKKYRHSQQLPESTRLACAIALTLYGHMYRGYYRS